MSREERLSAVGAMEGLSLVRQCELAGVSRSPLYYRPAGESEENLALMREIDETHLKYPFYGVRQMRSHLRLGGARVGVKRVRRLMRLMGLSALQPRPRTSSPAPGHRVYPYLLGGVEVVEADQAWCADITYIPVKSGFFYLVAVMDWATRCVLSWRLSNTMDAGFCVEALEDALRGGTPGIFNTDQGAQFTSLAFTERVLSSGAKVSMDGRGRYMDNIFIERLWRSLKYEAVYLHELEDGRHARAGGGGVDRLPQPREAPLVVGRAHARPERLPRGADRTGPGGSGTWWSWPEGNFRPCLARRTTTRSAPMTTITLHGTRLVRKLYLQRAFIHRSTPYSCPRPVQRNGTPSSLPKIPGLSSFTTKCDETWMIGNKSLIWMQLRCSCYLDY